MSQRFHLILFQRRGGQAVAEPRGAQLYLPPGKAHRMRRREALLIVLHQQGNAPLPEAEQQRLLDALAKRYFQSPGSAVAIMRELALALNTYFLQRNRKLAASGQQSVAWLTLAAWRQDNVYLTTAGPMSIRLLGPRPQRLDAAEAAGRGLGLEQAPRLHVANARLQPGDALLVAPALPPAWDETFLRVDPAQGLNPLLERMRRYQGEQAFAVLVQPEPGKPGLRRTVLLPGEGKEAPEPAAPQPTPQAPTASVPPKRPSAAQQPPRPEPRPATMPRPQPARRPRPSPTSPTEKPKPKQPAPTRDDTPRRPSALRRGLAALQEKVRAAGAALWQAGETLGRRLGKIIGGSLSLSVGEAFALPRSFLAVTAIAVPLVVVTVAMVVFIHRGRLKQYQAYMARAQAQASEALALQEPVTRHNALAEALTTLQTAEAYRQTDESRTLHHKLQAALDDLDGVQRLTFRLAAEPLPAGAHITRLLLRGPVLYALDEHNNKVYRLQVEGQAYRVDQAFQCNPHTVSALALARVGALQDIALVPLSTAGPGVVGLDARQHLIFCWDNGDASALPLPSITPQAWEQPMAIDYSNGQVFVLDPPAKVIETLTYDPEKAEFTSQARNFLSNGAPPTIDTAVDFVVLRSGLYLLSKEGQITRCLDRQKTVRCETMTYDDHRPGRSPGPVIADTRFSQIFLQPPPDPSLYLLDQAHNAVYRFSLQLAFVAQYRSQTPLPGVISAIAVNPDLRLLFIAVGNRIYQAPLE